jgi:magnesium-protoporphyrin IX monomethyl ester (oxidative) cyclase
MRRNIDEKKKIEKILLVSPHYTILRHNYKTLAPPLGLAYLAAVLEQEGYKVKILDVAAEGFSNETLVKKNRIRFGLSFREIERRTKEFFPDVVGVSCLLSNQFDSTKKICEIAKKINNNIITIVGGEHPSALPKETLSDSSIDFIIIGEGECSTVELLKRIRNRREPDNIDGIVFKNGRKIIVNPKTKFIEDLDRLPFPARHLLPMEIYFKVSLPQGLTYTKTPNTAMITSRGCSANCIFCATTRFWGNRHRTRSPENVLAEIEHLVNEYGIKEIQFIDDNLTLNKKRALNIFSGMKKRFKIAWSTPQGIAPWTLDEELLRAMKESGCYEVTLAIESGDPHVLRSIIGKPGSIERIRQLVKEIKRLKMMSKGFFVIGLPGETKEQIMKTFKLASELDLDSSSFFIATPLPGTRLHKICLKKGYLKKGFNFNELDYSIGNIETSEFSPREIEHLLDMNMLRLNSKLLLRNPGKFIKKYSLLLLNNPKIMTRYIMGLIRREPR